MKKLLIFTFLILSNLSFSYPIQKGIASFYAKKFHGKVTASGETYDMYSLTAAHRTLPMGTLVEVTNLENNKKVVVKINDRGPFKKDRIIDLSYAAAKKLDMIEKGTVKVAIRPLSPDFLIDKIIKDTTKEKMKKEVKDSTLAILKDSLFSVYTVQIAAFQNPKSAYEFFQSLQLFLKNVYINGPDNNKKLYKIQCGSFFNIEEAKSFLEVIKNIGYKNAFVTKVVG